MSEPTARTKAKLEGTFGAGQPFEQREAKPAYESVDVEYEGPQSRAEEKPELRFMQREARGEAASPEQGAPANRTEQEPQPFHQRVRRGDAERLGR